MEAGAADVQLTPLLLVAQAIKDAWRVKKVASVLYLDISQAFLNVAHERLLDRWRDMGLDEGMIEWMASFLQDHPNITMV